ncbi:class I SAM-dependent methyltransferase [Kitasatospora sp. NPDC048194]|uniref:class I SAM-dependent methyltransferase n=1 Tax=Kitasatospora sp. NPDC048194 TaxID=3364045 RepID=UPI003718A3F5
MTVSLGPKAADPQSAGLQAADPQTAGPSEDPHALAMYDYLHGLFQPPFRYLRDDGVATEDPIERRFEPPERFRDYERRAFEKAAGRTLDIGCGAGKHLWPLQRAGIEAHGIDISPLAVRICRDRGLTDVSVMDAMELDYPGGHFDSILLFSNGLAMGGTPAGVERLLTECHRVSAPGGRILLTNTDVSRTEDPRNIAYQRANRERGDLPGRVRLRSWYRDQVSEEFDWLFMSPEELTAAARATGWRVAEVDGTPWGGYAAVLERLPH